MSPERTAIFTSISTNYLDKALALVDSSFEHYPDTDFYVSVLNYRLLSEATLNHLARITTFYAERSRRLFFIDPLQLYKEPEELVFKYNIIEACTAVKPAVALMLLDRYSRVSYFDPDIVIYNTLPEDNILGSSWDFQVTPHILSPPIKRGFLSERIFCNVGVYNLGYFSANNTECSKLFLGWWKNFCIDYSLIAPHVGLFVDQKPIDFVSCFVDRLSVLRNPGCNVAWWNMFCDGRALLKDRVVSYKGRSEMLYFFHFSNLHSLSDINDRWISKPLGSLINNNVDIRIAAYPCVLELFEDYNKRLNRSEAVKSDEDSSFEVTESGSKIRGIVRKLYGEASRRGLKYSISPFSNNQAVVMLTCLIFIAKSLTYKDLKYSLKMFKQLLRSLLLLSLAKTDF